jgi:hypothetical protein
MDMLNKLMLFISSYVPLYALLILKNIFERITNGGHFVNVAQRFKSEIWFDEVNDWAVCVLALLIVVSVVYLKRILRRDASSKKYLIKEVSDETGNYYFNYVSICFLSCIGLSLNSIVDCFVFLFVMIIMGYIYINNNLMYLNPVAYIMGYKVYRCTLDSVNTNDKSFKSIVFAPKKIEVKNGENIYASGKQGFIYVGKKKK